MLYNGRWSCEHAAGIVQACACVVLSTALCSPHGCAHRRHDAAAVCRHTVSPELLPMQSRRGGSTSRAPHRRRRRIQSPAGRVPRLWTRHGFTAVMAWRVCAHRRPRARTGTTTASIALCSATCAAPLPSPRPSPRAASPPFFSTCLS